MSAELLQLSTTLKRQGLENSATLARLAETIKPSFDPLRVTGYTLPVAGDANEWYLASVHKPPRHYGLDINLNKAPYGDVELGYPVLATCNGVVVYAQEAPGAYWGNLVVVQSVDDDGLLHWRYAHLQEIRTYEGAYVLAGDEIGTIGKGKNDRYDAHLHLDPWRGPMLTPGAYGGKTRWIDPLIAWQAAGFGFSWGVR